MLLHAVAVEVEGGKFIMHCVVGLEWRFGTIGKWFL